jgi:hypothetical protein
MDNVTLMSMVSEVGKHTIWLYQKTNYKMFVPHVKQLAFEHHHLVPSDHHLDHPPKQYRMETRFYLWT